MLDILSSFLHNLVPCYVKYDNSLEAWKIDFVPITLKNTNNRKYSDTNQNAGHVHKVQQLL